MGRKKTNTFTRTQKTKFPIIAAIFLLPLSLFSQERTITGFVFDSLSKQPLMGAVVQFGLDGAVTDTAGAFSVLLKKDTATLTFSYVGYSSKQVKVDLRTDKLNIVLSEPSTLQQVVITGYTSQSKDRTTGSVNTLAESTIAQMKNSNGSFDIALQGAAPGIYVGTPTGQPGEAGRVTIRGLGSINGDTNPLYIVDGVPISAADFAAMNPADFENVNILKDAASTGPYGSRAANGVIVITTTKGKLPEGKKIKITYDVQVGMSQVNLHDWDQMNTTQRLQFEADIKDPTLPGWAYSPNNPYKLINGIEVSKTAADYSYGNHFLDSLEKINTNWLKQIFRIGFTQQHQLAMSGQNGRTIYYISAAYLNQEGVIKNSGLTRYNLRTNIQNTIGRLKSTLSFGIGYADIDYIIGEGGGAGAGGIGAGGGGFTTLNPVAALYYALPYESLSEGIGAGHTGNNAVDELNNDYFKEEQIKGIVSDNETFRILDQLQLVGTAGLEYTHSDFKTYYSPTSFLGQQVLNGSDGYYEDSIQSTIRAIATGGLRYLQAWGQHEVEINLLDEVNRLYGSNSGFSAYGIQPGLSNPGAGITQGTSTNNFIPNVFSQVTNNNLLESQILLVRYSYSDKYTFQGSLREDGSSQVPESNRYKTFYALGGSWNILKEAFMKNASAVTTLRLRGSYGLTGNAGGFNSDFGYKTLYANTNYNGQQAYSPIVPANPDYNWEINHIGDAGIDFGFFHDYLYGGLDFYDRITDNLFVNQNLSLTTGYQSLATNAGAVRNIGTELALNYDIYRKKGWKLTVGANFAYNNNKVLSLGSGLSQVFLDPYTVAQTGLPLGTFYLVRWDGVDPKTGAPIYLDKNGNPTETYNANDAVPLKKVYDPPIKGGITTRLSYKRFEFSVLLSFIEGMSRLDLTNFYVNSADPTNRYFNQSAEMLSVWTTPGQNTSITGAQYTAYPTSHDLHSSDYLKIRSVSVSYTFPVKKVLEEIKLYATGHNIWTFTKWKGFDPEDANDVAQYEYPAPRILTLGANVTFR